MTITYLTCPSQIALVALAMAVGTVTSARAQWSPDEIGPIGSNQPPPTQSAPPGAGAGGNQAATPSAPSNNQASGPPANNNSGPSQSPADNHEVQPVTGDLGGPGAGLSAVFGRPPVETVTEVKVISKDTLASSPYRLVQGNKIDGTPYAYIEGNGVRLPVVEEKDKLTISSAGELKVYTFRGSADGFPIVAPETTRQFVVITGATDATTTRVRSTLPAEKFEYIPTSGSQSGQGSSPPTQKDQKSESPPVQDQRGGKAGSGPGAAPGPAKDAKAATLENKNGNNNHNKSDNNNRELKTEREPSGHSGKPAPTPTKLQQAVATKSPDAAKLGEFDTSRTGAAPKHTDTTAAKAHETAPLTKFDTSHMGTTSSNGTKPASAPANTQHAGKLTTFDTSHMGVAAKLQQSLAKSASSTAAKTLAVQH